MPWEKKLILLSIRSCNYTIEQKPCTITAVLQSRANAGEGVDGALRPASCAARCSKWQEWGRVGGDGHRAFSTKPREVVGQTHEAKPNRASIRTRSGIQHTTHLQVSHGLSICYDSRKRAVFFSRCAHLTASHGVQRVPIVADRPMPACRAAADRCEDRQCGGADRIGV